MRMRLWAGSGIRFVRRCLRFCSSENNFVGLLCALSVGQIDQGTLQRNPHSKLLRILHQFMENKINKSDETLLFSVYAPGDKLNPSNFHPQTPLSYIHYAVNELISPLAGCVPTTRSPQLSCGLRFLVQIQLDVSMANFMAILVHQMTTDDKDCKC